MKQEIMM